MSVKRWSPYIFLIPLYPSSQLVNIVDISSVKNNLKLKLRNKIELKQIHQAQVVQTLDSAMQRINPYPVDKYEGNQLHYPLDRDLSTG